MKAKVEGDYNASQVSAVTQGLDGTPVILIQVHHPAPSHTHKWQLIPALQALVADLIVIFDLSCCALKVRRCPTALQMVTGNSTNSMPVYVDWRADKHCTNRLDQHNNNKLCTSAHV